MAQAEQKTIELEAEFDQTRELLTKEQERTARLTEEVGAATATTNTGEVAELKAQVKAAHETGLAHPEPGAVTKEDCIAALEAEIG